eukprot:915323-Pyramimonas_sp.AAC.1
MGWWGFAKRQQFATDQVAKRCEILTRRLPAECSAGPSRASKTMPRLGKGGCSGDFAYCVEEWCWGVGKIIHDM